MQEKLYHDLLRAAIDDARLGLTEGGVPVGAVLSTSDGVILGRGHNRRVQANDPSAHGETDAFRSAGRQTRYDDKILVTTLAPCWFCSGLIRQFRIGTVVIGDAETFYGGIDWLRETGTHVVVRQSEECANLMSEFIRSSPTIWNEDIGGAPEIQRPASSGPA